MSPKHTVLMTISNFTEYMPVHEQPDDMRVSPPTDKHRVIQPFQFLTPADRPTAVLIILNQPILGMGVVRLWKSTRLRVCADGGANQLFDYFDDRTRGNYVPDFIVGDMDLVRTEVRSFYEAQGTIVITQTSEYASDFTKALQLVQIWGCDPLLLNPSQVNDTDGLSHLVRELSNLKEQTVYVLSAVGGRLDQSMGLIVQFYTLAHDWSLLSIILLTHTDIIFAAPRGLNFVKYPSKQQFHPSKRVPACGILPFGTATILNSQGLRYDVLNWPSSLYGQVSTNNGVSGVDGFILNTTETVVINIEFDISVLQ